MSHRTSILLVLLSTAGMFTLIGLTFSGFFGPDPIGTTANATRPLIVPASYAFSIWTPIYVGLLVFPIYQLLQQRDNHTAWLPLRYWLSANVLANGAWLVAASWNWQWVTVGIISFMLFSLFRINRLLLQIDAKGAAYNFWVERLVFSLYFAWVTLATVLNVASALDFYRWSGWGLSDTAWTLVLGSVAAAITAFTALRFRDAAYPLVVVWAFFALGVRHLGSNPWLFGLAVVVCLLSLGVSLSMWPRMIRHDDTSWS